MKNTLERRAGPAGQHKTNETPRNGLAGLKQWRYDIPAALVVAMVSVPLSLGIALASGAPPICGLTSEIIAGLIFPLLGGAYVTVSGPAAGLAPILFGAITSLGQGDMQSGYRLVLAVIMLAGVLQLILTYFKAARFSQVFPTAAIHGMLAAIGFMLMAKQLPYFLGCKFATHEFFPMIMELPKHFNAELVPNVFSIGTICLLSLFLLTSKQFRGGLLRFVPPQLLVVLIGIALGRMFHIEARYLLQLPANPLAHTVVMPDFLGLLSHPMLIPTAILFIFALTFVDGTESLATVQAVDRIDPFRRRSSPDKTLMAMGVSNICSSLIGGLTIIPGIIKSTTCIMSGGRTAWVNFYNAIFLIGFLVAGEGLIKLIPLAALGAVLAHIGYKLAGPHKWRSMASHGLDQLLIFAITILVTLCSDLMLGIAAGMLAKFLIILMFTHHRVRLSTNSQCGWTSGLRSSFSLVLKSPIASMDETAEALNIHLSGVLSCFNTLKLRSIISQSSDRQRPVVIYLSPSVVLLDHSTNLYFQALQDEFKHRGNSIQVLGLSELERGRQASLRYRKLGADLVPRLEASNLLKV